MTLNKKFVCIIDNIDICIYRHILHLRKEIISFLYNVLSYLFNEYDNPTKCTYYIVLMQRPYTDYPHNHPYHRETIVHATVPICLHTRRRASFDRKKIMAISYIKCCSIYAMYSSERNYYSQTYHLLIDRFL